MDETYLARRKALSVAVAALCLETGFGSASEDALANLTEMIQSYIIEIGRLSQSYAEVAFRTQPTLTDVNMALVELGGPECTALMEHAKRLNKRHLIRQLRNYPPQTPKGMTVGPKVPRSSNMPEYLPALPDPHTFISTPTYLKPNLDYKHIREQLAVQKQSTRRGLSKFLAKTRPSRFLTGNPDSAGSISLIIPDSTSAQAPVYLLGIMPTEEDRLSPPPPPPSSDIIATDNDQEDTTMDTPDTTLDESNTLHDGAEKDETEAAPDNPFLRPPKRMKLKLKL